LPQPKEMITNVVVAGMQTVWVFGNATEILNVPVEYAEGYMTYGGSANGNETHDPSPIHFKGSGWRK
jgi:L-ascorbate oxidase